MRVKKMTGSIHEIEATFIIGDIRGNESKFEGTIEFIINFDDIEDLSDYDVFLPKCFFNEKLDCLIEFDNPLYDDSFEIIINDLVRSILLKNKEKVEASLRTTYNLDENEEILDIYDVCISFASNLRVVEGEILTVLHADVDAQASVTRQRFREVWRREYVNDPCCCNESEDYVGPCDCEQGYYQESIDKEFMKEETFEVSDACLTNIDISDIDICDKVALVCILKQAYREEVIRVFNTSYKDANEGSIFNETTVDVLKFTLNSVKIKRTLLTANSDTFSVDFN